MDPISMGIASSLIASGLARAGSIGFQRLLRLREIDRQLRNPGTASKPIQAAVKDLHTLMGSRYGQWTQSMSDFVQEILNSGVLTSIAECAILGKHSDAVENRFINIHELFFSEKEGDPKALYKQIYTSVGASIEAMTKDEGLAFLIKSSSNSIEKRLKDVAQLLSKAKHGRQDSKSDIENIRTSLLKISKALQGIYRNVRVETNKGARHIEISRVFIPPHLSPRGLSGAEEAHLQAAFQRLAASRRPRDLAHRAAHRATAISYGELRGEFNRVVILGDPGGGKSTLCQSICLDLAKGFALAAQHPEVAEKDGKQQKIPVRVIIRTFEKARGVTPQLGLYEFIRNELSSITSMENDELEAAVRYGLEYGIFSIFFDGLDEILDTSNRREFVDLVDAFSSSFPLCPIFVTSRLIGYENAPLPAEFDQLFLLKFNEEEVFQYSKKFMRVVAGMDVTSAEREAKEFIAQTEKNARDLRQNPLLLGLMAWLYHLKGDVPSNRPEIYRECATLMFEKWDANRGIKASIPDDFNMLSLFSALASEIFSNSEYEEGVSTDWIRSRLEAFFSKVYEDRSRSVRAAKQLIEFITGRSWVMTEVGENVFRFTHRTFLEYFYARHLEQSHDAVVDLLRLLRPRIAKAEWDMVAHLALQLKTHGHQRRIEEALSELAKAAQMTRGSAREALTWFGARALEYLPGSEPQVRRTIIALAQVVAELLERRRSSTLGVLAQVCECTQTRRALAEQVVADVLVRWLDSDDKGLQIWACSAVSPPVGIHFGRGRGRVGIRTVTDRVAASVKMRSKETLGRLADDSAFFARVYWEWHQERFSKYFSRHGMSMIFSDKRLQSSNLYSDLFGYLIFKFSDIFTWLLEDSEAGAIGKKSAEEALDRIGKSFPLRQISKEDIQDPPIVFWMIPTDIISDVFSSWPKGDEKIWAIIYYVLIHQELGSSFPSPRGVSGEFRSIDTLKSSDLFKGLLKVARSGADSNKLGYIESWLHGDVRAIQ